MKKIIILATAALLFTCCTSVKQTSPSVSETYFEKNASSFEVMYLENGIPLIVKQNENQQVVSLSIMIEGGNALLDPSQSGIENMTLSMMTRGSSGYTYEEIQKQLYFTKGSISGYTANGYSYFSLNCINHHFSNLFSIFADAFLNPSFTEKEFGNVKNENIQTLQSIMNDPFSLAQYSAERTVYKNHPFETDIRPTYETIQTVSLDQISDFHKTLLNSKRITIVAAGNFDPEYLKKRLNAAFFVLPSQDYVTPLIPQVTISGDPVIMSHPSAAGTGFLVKTYPFPQFNDLDYMPSLLACTIYSETLFNIVREKYGACYSIGNTPVLSKAPYMMLYVNSASDIENMPSYINEAQSLMSEGKVIDSKNPETNEFTYLTLEETLEGYKNSLINSLFSAYITSSGEVTQIMGSLHLTGEKEAYLKLLKRIEDVSADDIRRVFNSYWINSSGQWFIVTGPENADKVPVELYK